LIGGADHINKICGKLRLGKEVLATIDGYWDGVINITDKRTGVCFFLLKSKYLFLIEVHAHCPLVFALVVPITDLKTNRYAGS